MPVNKVWIIEGCIACGLCSDICPDVFELEDVATVKNNVNYSEFENEIMEAAEGCPTEVIKYE
jgi:ferredoxin